MNAIQGVLFDKDGTLFDFNASWAGWTKALLGRLAGGDLYLQRRLAQAVDFDLDEVRFEPSSVIIAGTPDEIADILLPHLPGFGKAGLLSELNVAAAGALMAEAAPLKPLLKGLLGRGLRLGVATNDAVAPTRSHLEAAEIYDVFDYIAGFDSGYGAKPGPGMLLEFARQVGVAPENIIMVGDSRHDLIAGRAAGMGTVGVLTGLAEADELAPLSDIVLPHIGHLPAWIESLGQPDPQTATAAMAKPNA